MSSPLTSEVSNSNPSGSKGVGCTTSIGSRGSVGFKDSVGFEGITCKTGYCTGGATGASEGLEIGAGSKGGLGTKGALGTGRVQ